MAHAAIRPAVATPSRGRPREFDLAEALDKAIAVFSERGYHATSISDLTQAMELASGSIYKAFPDKQAVFLAALDRYMEVRGSRLGEVISGGRNGRDRIRKALVFYIESSHGRVGQQGCMVVGSAAELASSNADVARRVRAAFDKNETMMTDLIVQGQADGSIAQNIAVRPIVRSLLCVVQGLRVVSKTGRSRAEMMATVEIIMKMLS